MTSTQLLAAVVLFIAPYCGYLLGELHRTRDERDIYRADAQHNYAEAVARRAARDVAMRDSLASMIEITRLREDVTRLETRLADAESVAAEMARQRDDQRRRLALSQGRA